MKRLSPSRDQKLLDSIDRLTPIFIGLVLIILLFFYFNIPTLIKFLFRLPEHDGIYVATLSLLQNSIVNLIPTVLTFLLSFVLIRKIQEIRTEMQNEKLISQMNIVVTDSYKMLQSVDDFGIIDIYKRISDSDISEQMSGASKIRILQTWFNEPHDYGQILRRMNDKLDYDIKILLLDPDSEFAIQRSRDLTHSDNVVPSQIKLVKDSIIQIKTTYKLDKLEIRYYKSLPSLPIYIFDDVAYFGVFPHSRWADTEPWFKIGMRKRTGKESTRFGAFLEEEFEKVWEISHEV
jgi:hypothetical protein